MEMAPIRKIWIVIVSMLAILTSSFASSAPTMTFQMLDLSSHSAQSHAMKTSSHCASMSMDVTMTATIKVNMATASSSEHSHDLSQSSHQPNSAKVSCADNHDSTSSCCSAVCANIVVIQAATEEPISRKVQRALIVLESQDALLTRQTSLLRPPIA